MSQCESEAGSTTIIPPVQLVARDSSFYISDGNTIIRVGNILFKVHRSMLMKDGSAFEMMFGAYESNSATNEAVVQCPVPLEGTCDEYPIILQDDTVDEFRALMFSLYALPLEIELAVSDDVQLVCLARIAHKYQFRSIERWALQALMAYYTKPWTYSVETLVKVTEVAVLCDYPQLLDTTIVKWKRLLGEGRAIGKIIVMAERLSLRGLLGMAYHAMLLQGRAVWNTDPDLAHSHRIRLLSGYYNISRVCARLPFHPPRLEHHVSCVGRERCEEAWASCWKLINTDQDGGIGVQVMQFQNVDLLGRIRLAEIVVKAFVEHQIPTECMVDGIHAHCLKSTLKATQVKVREIQEQLVDWFSDVP